MGRRGIRLCRTSVLVAAILGTAFVGVALAASNSIRLTVPKHASTGVGYSVRVRGQAVKTKTLYLFIDYYKCGRTPYAEYYRHRANGDYWTVHGSFKKVSSGWHSPLKARYHACAYLVKRGEARIPNRGIILRASRSFRVH